MADSDKVLLSSTPTKSSVRQKASASDENYQYHQQLGNSHIRSPKKPLAKNYMSPTISATSKAIASGKNILGERNEAPKPNFCNTLVEKSPHIEYADENCQYHQQLGNSHLRSPKKPLAKNYKSPTISATPKAIASGKNIFGERNEAPKPNFCNTIVEKSPHISTDNGNDSLSQDLPLTPLVFQSHDDSKALSDSLSSRPYDPITNYLSPRPQFLRYKPNRCRKLFLGLENGVTERNEGLGISRSGCFDSQKAIDEEAGAATIPSSLASPRQDGFLSRSGSFDSQKAIDEEAGAVTTPSSLASPNQDGLLKQEDEEVEVSDGEIEESDEEIEGSDEKIEESDEEYEEVKLEKKGWKLRGFLKSLLLLLVLVFFTSHISTMNHQTVFEGVQDDGYCSIQNHTLEAALLKKLESRGMLWDEKEERHMGLVEIMGVEEGKVVEFESGSEVMGQGEEDTQMDSMEEVLELKDEEIEAMEVTEQEENGVIDELGEKQVEAIDETFDQMAENSDQIPGEVDHLKRVYDVSNDLEEEGEVAVEQIDGMVENKMEGLEQYFTNMIAEPAMSETMDNHDDMGFDEIVKLEAEGNWREELIKHMKLKTLFTALVGISIFSVIVASLVLVLPFRFKQRNGTKKGSYMIENPCVKRLIIEHKKTIAKVSSPPLKPYSEPVIAEKYKPVLPYSEPVIAEKNMPVLPNRGEDNIEHVYSSFRRMSLSSKHSTEAASEENYHSQAPAVELLGEFVVGEVSSALRTCTMKNKITESEESNYSVSSKKKLGSKVESISFQAQSTASAFSSMEGGKDVEVTTPLRRSSRIRNRTVMSP